MGALLQWTLSATDEHPALVLSLPNEGLRLRDGPNKMEREVPQINLSTPLLHTSVDLTTSFLNKEVVCAKQVCLSKAYGPIQNELLSVCGG